MGWWLFLIFYIIYDRTDTYALLVIGEGLHIWMTEY